MIENKSVYINSIVFLGSYTVKIFDETVRYDY